MPEFSTDITKVAKDLTDAAKDATYVAIGLGVLGFQRAQVARKDLTAKLGDPKAIFDGRLGTVREDLTGAVHAVDAQIEEVFAKVDAAIVPWEDKLPGQAKAIAKQIHTQASEIRQQIRGAVLSAAA